MFVSSVVCSVSLKANCATRLEDGTILYGTPIGVYRGTLGKPTIAPTMVLALEDTTQVDVLEDTQRLLVLTGRRLLSFPITVLDSPNDPSIKAASFERVSSRVSFTRVGRAFGSTGICIVKSNALLGTSTIKVMRPRPQGAPPSVLGDDGTESFQIFKELSIPVETRSVHILSSNLCVGTSKGFELVDLQTCENQALLDPTDATLDFAREQKPRFKIGRTLVNWPISMYRLEAGYLLCYNVFAFYVDRDGKRTRPDFRINWDEWITETALQYPYVLAFSPNKVQVWHVEMGSNVQTIGGIDLKLLYAKPPPPGIRPGPSSTTLTDAEVLYRTNDTVMALQM